MAWPTSGLVADPGVWRRIQPLEPMADVGLMWDVSLNPSQAIKH